MVFVIYLCSNTIIPYSVSKKHLCKHCYTYIVPRNISLRFSRNSEANASEFPENRKEMFFPYYIDLDIANVRLSKVICKDCK